MTIKSSLNRILFLGMTLACVASHAAAAEPLVVYADQARIIDLPRGAGVVVVGNPSIADATIQGQKVFLHGRSFGTTNIVILDEHGAQIADYEIDVQLGGRNNVALFEAGLLRSYVCANECETIMHVGDTPDHMKDWVLDRNKDKIELATGQKSAEADEAKPPE